MIAPAPLTALLAALVAALAFASLLVGAVPISPDAVLAGLVGRGEPLIELVVGEVRLPRALLAATVGATLGLAGAALQGYLRNPLAEPGLIGISAGAAFGAVLAIYTGLSLHWPLALPLAGMSGAMLAMAAVFLLSGYQTSVVTLILAGIAVNSFAGALTALALNLAPSYFAALEIVFWLLGSLADRSMDHVAVALAPMIAGWLLLLSVGRGLDALSLGEDAARSLGFNIAWLQLRTIFGTALAVGAAVSVTGIIGFVGLVVPHLLRPLVGHQPSRLLAASALGGAALTLAADIVVRLLPTTTELKLGVVTAIIGAPFFLALVVHHRRSLT